MRAVSIEFTPCLSMWIDPVSLSGAALLTPRGKRTLLAGVDVNTMRL
jgi:hypothetical protein